MLTGMLCLGAAHLVCIFVGYPRQRRRARAHDALDWGEAGLQGLDLDFCVTQGLAVGVMMVLWVQALLFDLPCQGPGLSPNLSQSRLLSHQHRHLRQNHLGAVRAVAMVSFKVGLPLGRLLGLLREVAQGSQSWRPDNQLIASLGFEGCCPPSKA